MADKLYKSKAGQEVSTEGIVLSVTGTAVDNTDPQNPVISSTASGGSSVTQIQLSEQGAKADAISKSDGAISSGTATLNSATGEFTANDVGKTIFIGEGAGGSNLPLVTTIASFVSATQITLTASAGATVSNAYYIYGTDNTATIQNALDEAAVIASTYGKASVQCEVGTYLIAGEVTNNGNGENAQIKWPYANESEDVSVIELLGATNASIPRLHWDETKKHGTVFQSTKVNVAYSSTTGLPSVIGSPSSYSVNHSVNGGWDGFNYVGMVIRDITIRQDDNPWLTGIDAGWVHNATIERVQVDTIVTGLAATVPTHPTAIGVQFPVVNFRGPGIGSNVTVKGYYSAFGLGELLNGNRLEGILCRILVSLTPAYHANYINFLEDINCIHGFAGLDPATGVIDIPSTLSWIPDPVNFGGGLNVQLWTIQDNNGQVAGFNRIDHIKDINSVSKVIGYYTIVSAGGTRELTDIIISGATTHYLKNLFTVTDSSGGGVVVDKYLNVNDFYALAGATAQSLQNGFPAWLFDSTASEAIFTSVRLPSHWATYQIYIHWTNNGAGTGNVVWRHDRKSAALDGSFTSSATAGTPLTVAAPSAGVLKRTLLQSDIPVSGEIQNIQVARIGNDAGDTLDNDASLLGVLLVKQS